jgi:D-arabinose 1-dehydrogenase-like Zn-dependent alcohol dehydrogenase
VPEDLSASAIALVEPWACVEDCYVEKQRQALKKNGRMLVVGELPVDKSRVQHLAGNPAAATFTTADKLSGLKDAGYDDVIYFGSNALTVETLFPKVAAGGLFNIVQCGGKFGRPVVSQIGRVHYGGIRVIGTPGSNPAEAMSAIPATAEIRPGDKINIVGAAGPMGTMHVIRDLCQGVPNVTVFAGDLNDERLASLQSLAEPLARRFNVALRPYNPQKEKLAETFDYIVLMAPVPALVAQAIPSAAKGGIINIFAGIPAAVTAQIDLDQYVEKQLYFIGTSGSVLDDMKQVLAKVVARRLDTNLSVAAVAGLDGAIDGIRAVEKNLMPGKILVYPSCRGLKLTPLTELGGTLPLENGRWTRQAEESLVKQFSKP